MLDLFIFVRFLNDSFQKIHMIHLIIYYLYTIHLQWHDSYVFIWFIQYIFTHDFFFPPNNLLYLYIMHFICSIYRRFSYFYDSFKFGLFFFFKQYIYFHCSFHFFHVHIKLLNIICLFTWSFDFKTSYMNRDLGVLSIGTPCITYNERKLFKCSFFFFLFCYFISFYFNVVLLS